MAGTISRRAGFVELEIHGAGGTVKHLGFQSLTQQPLSAKEKRPAQVEFRSTVSV
jgi:hypothetical protein